MSVGQPDFKPWSCSVAINWQNAAGLLPIIAEETQLTAIQRAGYRSLRPVPQPTRESAFPISKVGEMGC